MAKFSSKLGVIAATAGSAVGLGTIWRFPAEVQQNGGAAFLLVYIICMFVLGIPVMLAEFSLGRGGQSDCIGVFKRLAPGTHWKYAGWMAILSSYIIMGFYMVVVGWTAEYLWESITGGLYQGLSGESLDYGFHNKMMEYTATDWRPFLFTCVAILINLAVVIGGVQKGIERLSNIMMPLLFVLLVVFAIVAMTFSNAWEGLQYFFAPDFSKITPKVILNALGQTFFSMSLGMGILVTYGAYYPKNINMPKSSLIVSSMVIVVAILMGMIIFPAVMSFGLDMSKIEGAALVFITLPEVFAQMPCTPLWSILFFILLLIAAITSTISTAEVSISMLENRFKMGRKKAALIVMAPLFLFSGVCALSFGALSHITIFGMTIFNFIDNLATNIVLPIVSIAICIFMGWFAPRGFFRKEMTNDGTVCTRLYPIVLFIVRFIAPLLVLMIFIYGLL